VIKTTAGDLTLTFLGHASVQLNFNGKGIYADPFGKVADYSNLPKADIILFPHDHFYHCDPQAIAVVRAEKTHPMISKACSRQLKGGLVMHTGDTRTAGGFPIEAVPAYNLPHKRENGQPFHVRGDGGECGESIPVAYSIPVTLHRHRSFPA
jgi:L-ascorbate metabolism protein UlaG (beta-lactamase superfamily)